MSLEHGKEFRPSVENNLSLPGRVVAGIGKTVFSILPNSGCPIERLDANAAERAAMHEEIEAALAQIDAVTRPPSEQ